MAIHCVYQDDGVTPVYVISSRGTWLQGCYSCERGAKLAFRLPDEALVKFNKPSPATYEEVLAEFRLHKQRERLNDLHKTTTYRR